MLLVQFNDQIMTATAGAFSYQGFVQLGGKKVAWEQMRQGREHWRLHHDSWRGTVEFYLDRKKPDTPV